MYLNSEGLEIQRTKSTTSDDSLTDWIYIHVQVTQVELDLVAKTGNGEWRDKDAENETWMGSKWSGAAMGYSCIPSQSAFWEALYAPEWGRV